MSVPIFVSAIPRLHPQITNELRQRVIDRNNAQLASVQGSVNKSTGAKSGGSVRASVGKGVYNPKRSANYR